MYPIALAFSLLFSIPTFLVYALCFLVLKRNRAKNIISKLILISISVVGIGVTMFLMNGSMGKNIVMSYSITSIVIGLILKLDKAKS